MFGLSRLTDSFILFLRLLTNIITVNNLLWNQTQNDFHLLFKLLRKVYFVAFYDLLF